MCYQLRETFKGRTYPKGYKHRTKIGATIAKWRAERAEKIVRAHRAVGAATYRVDRVPCHRFHLIGRRLAA